MKKVAFAPLLFVLAIVGLSSCADCKVCTKDSEPEIRICEKDYDTETEYGLAIDFEEAAGYECN